MNGIMKNFIFRKDWNGFEDWIKSIKEFRWVIKGYKCGAKNQKEYTEANWWYANYLEYMKGLDKNQKEYIKSKENGHIPDWHKSVGIDLDFMFNRWLEVVGDFKLNRLEEISNEEVGAAIKKAREHRCMNRAQVAGVIGIGADTLKCYEEGRRTLPFNIYYKLIQLFEFDIGIMKIK